MRVFSYIVSNHFILNYTYLTEYRQAFLCCKTICYINNGNAYLGIISIIYMLQIMKNILSPKH